MHRAADDDQERPGVATVQAGMPRQHEEDDEDDDEEDDYDLAAYEAADRWRQCNLLATALAEYSVDGRAAVTMPLLAVARDPRDAALLPDLARSVHRLGQAVDANAAFLADALDACPGLRDFLSGDGSTVRQGNGHTEPVSDGGIERPNKRVRPHSQSTQHLEWSSPEREQHREDVRCVLKQLAREWSEDGAEERRHTHGPVLEALVKYVPPGSANPESTKAGVADGYRRGSNRLGALVTAALHPRSTHDCSPAVKPEDGCGCNSGTELQVLVPGSGLGRLACEIAGIAGAAGSSIASSSSNGTTATSPTDAWCGGVRGYAVEACESGAVMSAVAELIIGLTSEQREKQWRVHPFLHDGANRLEPTDQTRPVLLPDVAPYQICNGPGESRCGCRKPSTSCAEFVSEYQRPEHRERWDAVVTSFFLDTAKNPLDYIRTIAHCLKPGTGVWINSGPLLWHQSGNPPYDCLQLTQRELLKACELAGFQLLEEPRVLKRVPYCRDKASLMRVEFDTVFWVHRKQPKDQL